MTGKTSRKASLGWSGAASTKSFGFERGIPSRAWPTASITAALEQQEGVLPVVCMFLLQGHRLKRASIGSQVRKDRCKYPT